MKPPTYITLEKNISKSLWKILGRERSNFFCLGHNDMAIMALRLRKLVFIEYLKLVIFAE